jgi:Cu/Ag efflux protein CusF
MERVKMFNTESRTVSNVKPNDFIQFAFDRETNKQVIWQVKDIQPIAQSWEDVKFKKQKRVNIFFHNDIKIVENVRTKMFVVTDKVAFTN